MVTMLSKNVPRRRFSFSSCWLLSKFTVGTSNAGKPRASMNGAIGTVPPSVRSCTGGAPNIVVTAATAARACGSDVEVRNALIIGPTTVSCASFPYLARVASFGEPAAISVAGSTRW